jgi:DNA invertase Pin-like site-specific DNA recombinase
VLGDEGSRWIENNVAWPWRTAGVDLYLHQQALDTSTPSGRMLFGMLGVFAEFERSMIRDRVMAGLDRARAANRRLGRPPMPEARVEKVRRALGRGAGRARDRAAAEGQRRQGGRGQAGDVVDGRA